MIICCWVMIMALGWDIIKMEKTLRESFSVFGKTTLRKLSKLKIYVEGLSKIGADLVTNLVLLNPHLITLHDLDLIRPDDPFHTYHYPKEHVGRKTRADYLIQMCHRLNNKVYVDKVNAEITEETCLKYDIIVFCDMYDVGRVLNIDRAIRQQKQKTVILYACQLGYSGIILSDFGEEWDMFHSGQDSPKIPIQSISNSQRGKVTTEVAHNYHTGDFVSISSVEGMKYINTDARPVTVLDELSFEIEDTRGFGTYQRGGYCEKINLLEKLRFASLDEQLSKRHSEMMLTFKSIVCFYQNNNKLPDMFNPDNEEETMENLRTLASKFDQKFNEQTCRDVIKTCGYSFYPITHMLAAMLTLECVKCTGKFRPIASPFIFDAYSKFRFESKTKLEGQPFNIIDTNTLEQLARLQVGVVDEDSQSLELLNLLRSCSIAEKTRVVLCGLESINESQEVDSVVLKAQLKYRVASQLFKDNKIETVPCSLSFSNDLILEDMWKKIKVLINTSSRLNEYIYNNVVWNELHVVDSVVLELTGEVNLAVPNKSELRQERTSTRKTRNEKISGFKECVEDMVEIFRLIFLDVFEDMRCFFICGNGYIDKVKMEADRKNIFLFLICCLEDGGYLDPENIVKICRYIHAEIFPGGSLDSKDHLTMDFLRSLYFLISWFFVKKEPEIEEITNNFTMYLGKVENEPKFTQQEKYDIAYSKLAMRNQFVIPYLSLGDLYRKEHTIKFIWNGSQILAKKRSVDEEISSKKFYKNYYGIIKPCPFMTQIINSLIPMTIMEALSSRVANCKVDLLGGKISSVECPKPRELKASPGMVLVPPHCNEWTLVVIEGPKKLREIIERFSLMENVKVVSIKYGNKVLYDEKRHEGLDQTVENLVSEKRDSFELHIGAQDKDGVACQVCRVKYLSK